MKHNFYANCSNRGGRSVEKNIKPNHYPRFPNQKPKVINTNLLSLRALVTAVLNEYANDPDERANIMDEIRLFEVNYAIASDLKDTKSQKALMKHLRNYLTELL